jgi:hypothetical protein
MYLLFIWGGIWMGEKSIRGGVQRGGPLNLDFFGP